MLKRMAITITFLLIASICLPLYSYAAETGGIEIDNRVVLLESVRQNYLASLRLEALKTGNIAPDNMMSGSAGNWLKRVNASEVNMVTNRRLKDGQDTVLIKGKAYHTSGESYVWTMQQNPSIRFAKDPFTGKTIDKADAVIFANASGKVLYFESEESYKGFIGLAVQETVFGYTKPN